MQGFVGKLHSRKTPGGPQNDGLEKVTPLKKTAILGTYVRFLVCTWGRLGIPHPTP